MRLLLLVLQNAGPRFSRDGFDGFQIGGFGGCGGFGRDGPPPPLNSTPLFRQKPPNPAIFRKVAQSDLLTESRQDFSFARGPYCQIPSSAPLEGSMRSINAKGFGLSPLYQGHPSYGSGHYGSGVFRAQDSVLRSRDSVGRCHAYFWSAFQACGQYRSSQNYYRQSCYS